MTLPQNPSKRPSGMFGLTLILLGQAVSILASNMTGFALSIWVFKQTESATTLGIMQTAFTLPYLLIIPLAGVMVDRYNRKLMMMISDLTAGLGTLGIVILFATGNLEIWHFYLINILIGLGNAFQWPAYSAAITTMVPKEQYGRANGMMSFVQASPAIVAPLMAGALMPIVGLNGILMIDVITFVLAIGALALVQVPTPPQSKEGKLSQGNFWQEITFGFKFIFQRPGLFGYVMLLFSANLFMGISGSVHVPMVLLRTDNSSLILGTVQTAGAVSWTLGSVLMSAWGGPKRRLHGTLLGWSLYCLFGNILFGLSRSLEGWIPTLLISGIGASVGIATSNAMLQIKVPPDIQGRVFSARRMLAWFPDTFTPILGGLLADRIMEPAMQSQNAVTALLGWLVGTERGAGMSAIMIVFGLLTTLTLLSGYLFPHIRNMEDVLPDHDQMQPEKID